MEQTTSANSIQDGEILQFVCFKLADEEYALDIKTVRGVIRVPHITPVPQMPDFCLGVINIRGNIVPVFDLRRRFGLFEKGTDSFTKIIVINVDNLMVSIIVDEIMENIKMEGSKIDPSPAVKMKIERACVKGIGELEDRMLIILDMIKLHEFIKSDIKAGVSGPYPEGGLNTEKGDMNPGGQG